VGENTETGNVIQTMTMPAESPTKKIVSLLSILAICYMVAFVGAIAVNHSIADWYIAIQKPSWNPPAWLFAPVWTVLYGLMGWAAWIVWESGERKTAALVWFGVQLALNGLWSWIFFYFNKLLPGFIEISILWFAILLTAIQFGRIRPAAGWLLMPYLAWVAFAGALNFAIWRMNGQSIVGTTTIFSESQSASSANPPAASDTLREAPGSPGR